ncbi:kinetochore-associated Ndc80 complex subunit spc24 [Podochytrium sp. JEL0797]|nr:kinetochore-associated Ndc80 complex subunit spc24 [Podochytrium sp. JEL0797]
MLTSTFTDDDHSDDEAIKMDAILPSLLEQMDPAEDVACLRDVVQGLAATKALRAKQLKDDMAVLKRLSAELEAAHRTNEQALKKRELTKKDHAANLAALEDEKYTVVKSMHDLEKSVASLEAQKRDLLVELEALKKAEDEEEMMPPDESVLKLSIYQSLGIDLVYENDKVVRCLVRSVNKNDITPLEINDSKFSNFYYANMLWDMCS